MIYPSCNYPDRYHAAGYGRLRTGLLEYSIPFNDAPPDIITPIKIGAVLSPDRNEHLPIKPCH